ncbi:MAG: hypothetical protein ACI9NQ_000490 [Paracoccaceae bacterium]|jgi:hypothetical protein
MPSSLPHSCSISAQYIGTSSAKWGLFHFANPMRRHCGAKEIKGRSPYGILAYFPSDQDP